MGVFVTMVAAVVLVLLRLDDAVTIAALPQRLGSPAVASAGVHGEGNLRGDATGSGGLEASAISFAESNQQHGMVAVKCDRSQRPCPRTAPGSITST